MLSVEESAKLLKVSPARVRALVAKGTLPAQKIGRVWTLKEEDVMQRVLEKPRSGRPRTEEARTCKQASRTALALGKNHEAYAICKQYLASPPTAEELALMDNPQELAFRKHIARFFADK